MENNKIVNELFSLHIVFYIAIYVRYLLFYIFLILKRMNIFMYFNALYI